MALAKYEDTIFQTDSGRAYSGVVVEALSGGIPAQLYFDDIGTEAFQITSNPNGLFTFWVEEGTYDLRYSVGGVAVGTQDGVAIYNLVREIELAADTGAEGVGVASGETLQEFLDTVDQVSTNKANASALGVAGADTDMGAFTGSTIPDSQTAKQAIQAVETAVELRTVATDLASATAAKGSDLVNFTGKTIAPTTVNASGDNSFGTGFDKVQAFRGRITLGALSGPMSFGDLQYCGIQNFGRYDIDGNYAAIQHTTDDSCALFGFFKARGSQTSPSAVVVNDDVGELSFHAWDGATFVKGALVTPIVKSVASGIISMSIRFWTMNSSGVLVNAVDIDETQRLVALKAMDAKSTTAGGSALRAYYPGSTGGGAEIRGSNGFSSTVPVYGFWFNNGSGIGNPATNITSIISNGAEAARWDDTGRFIHGGTTAFAKATIRGGVALQPPNYQSGTSYSVIDNDLTLIFTNAGTVTLTLPSAATYTGRILKVKGTGGGALVSASSNVAPLSGAVGTAILAASAGKWAELQSDGTNWVIMQGN